MSLLKDHLRGRLGASIAQLERIRKRIEDLNLEISKETDDLVTARKNIDDINLAIEAIPEERK